MAELAGETLIAEDAKDARRWTALVERSASPDVYYLPEYACASAEIEETEAKGFIGGPALNGFLAPLLIRRLSGSGMEWSDAASPYGYGGMLTLADSGGGDQVALRCFFAQLREWCLSEGIVCCVIRLHPLTGQDEWFLPADRWAEVRQVCSRRRMSSIDCCDWDEKEDVPRGMNHGRHEDMRLARRALRVTWTDGDDAEIETSLVIFRDLYNGLLERTGAADFYRFPPRYYTGLAKLGKQMGVVIAWCEGKPVGANIALAGSQYAYGHLSGTSLEGRKHGASTLLNIEEARWARKKGCQLLYLGGGMRPGDGIEKYKSSFGGPSHKYSYLTFVADRERFDCIRKLADAPWPYNVAGASG